MTRFFALALSFLLAFGSACTDATGPIGQGGPQGPAGIAGPVGPQGPIGLTGPAGLDGVNGTNGLDGLPGPQGIQGLPGLNGAQGIQGPIGLPGPQGVQGLPGAVGVQGTPGSNGLDGVSPTVAVEPIGTNCQYGGAAISDGLGNVAYVCGAATVLPPPTVAFKVKNIWPCSNGGTRSSNVISIHDQQGYSGWPGNRITVNGPLEAWSDGTVRIGGYILVKEPNGASISRLAYYDLTMADGSMSCTARVLPANYPYPTTTNPYRFSWTNCAFSPCNGQVEYAQWSVTP